MYFYPPAAVDWRIFELTARGYVPRPDEDTFEIGDRAAARKRRLEGVEKGKRAAMCTLKWCTDAHWYRSKEKARS